MDFVCPSFQVVELAPPVDSRQTQIYLYAVLENDPQVPDIFLIHALKARLFFPFHEVTE